MTTLKVGREKRHFLDPVPIRLVHDRWIGKFAEPIVGSLTAIKTQLETPDGHRSTTSTPSTSRPRRSGSGAPSSTATTRVRYYYGTRVASTGRPGRRSPTPTRTDRSRPTARSWRSSPGRSVTMSFHPRWEPEIEAEGPVRMTWTVEPAEDGRRALTVTSALVPGSHIEARVLRRGRVHRVRSQDLPRDGRAAGRRLSRPIGPIGHRHRHAGRRPSRRALVSRSPSSHATRHAITLTRERTRDDTGRQLPSSGPGRGRGTSRPRPADRRHSSGPVRAGRADHRRRFERRRRVAAR